MKLYPSNWLYNASVIGFLKISKIEPKFEEDGTVEIDKDIFNNEINCDELYFTENKVSSIIGSSKQYKNYIQSCWKDGFKEFVKRLSSLEEANKCSFCGAGWFLPNKEKESLTKKYKYMNKFFDGIERFTMRLSAILGPSEGEFPNAFWNLNVSLSICHLCAYLIIHHHAPFVERKSWQKIFINAPSFKIMWHLNKFSAKLLQSKEQYNLKKILGMSMIELSQKIYVSLGAWSIMNIEMVIMMDNSIDYYSLPYEISLILMQKDIASLISQTNEPWILELILDGKFDMLLNLLHKIIRYGVSNTNAHKDKYLSKLKNRDTYSLQRLSGILPELYVKINSILKRR